MSEFSCYQQLRIVVADLNRLDFVDDWPRPRDGGWPPVDRFRLCTSAETPCHPIAAPRINAAGLILGSLMLSASGLHRGNIDWNRVRIPLGYIPAAAIVGFQNELRRFGRHLTSSRFGITKLLGSAAKHPYALSALLSSYGVVELMKSALHANDAEPVAISAADGLGILFLPLFDYGRVGEKLDCISDASTVGKSHRIRPHMREQLLSDGET